MNFKEWFFGGPQVALQDLLLKRAREEETELLGRRQAAAKLLEFEEGGAMAAQPAGLDPQTGITWNQPRPEDATYKRELAMQSMGGPLEYLKHLRANDPNRPLTKDDFIDTDNGTMNVRTQGMMPGTATPKTEPDWKDPNYLKYLGAKANTERPPTPALTPVETYQKTFGPLEAGMTAEIVDGRITGRQVPIAGTQKDPAVIAQTEAAAKAKTAPDAESAAASMLDDLYSIKADAEEIRDNPNLNIAVGPIHGRMASVTGPGTNLDTKIGALKSKLSVASLQAMKARGLSSGTITESEWPRFESLVTSLDQIQDETQYVTALNEVISFTDRAMGNVKTGFKGKFGKELGWKPPEPRAKTARPGVRPSKDAPGSGAWSITRVK